MEKLRRQRSQHIASCCNGVPTCQLAEWPDELLDQLIVQDAVGSSTVLFCLCMLSRHFFIYCVALFFFCFI